MSRCIEPGVGHRDDRVVVPGQDESRLAQPRQERHGRPARHRGELVVVTARRPGPLSLMQGGAGRGPVGPGRAAVEVAGAPAAGGRGPGGAAGTSAAPAPRAGPAPSARPPRWRPAPPAAPGPLDRGEVLRHRAAPGDAEHVRLLVAELGEQPGDQPQPGETVRPRRQRRAADAGRVEPDHLGRRIHRGRERLECLQASADAIDQQQRRARRVAYPVRPGLIATLSRCGPTATLCTREGGPQRAEAYACLGRAGPWDPAAPQRSVEEQGDGEADGPVVV